MATTINVSQPGGQGSVAASGTVDTGVRCYLSVAGSTPTTWTWALVAPFGSIAVINFASLPGLSSPVGPYFDPDIDGAYKVTFTDQASAVTTTCFNAATPAFAAQSLENIDP